ncbi:hypothetical protein [Gordonia sp. NPDC058843]|uniref:hypothetical protein n=1 Tax=Gordonia sp. NPDC058843 TaxID=3346648 RepID=UPI00367D5C93
MRDSRILSIDWANRIRVYGTPSQPLSRPLFLSQLPVIRTGAMDSSREKNKSQSAELREAVRAKSAVQQHVKLFIMRMRLLSRKEQIVMFAIV